MIEMFFGVIIGNMKKKDQYLCYAFRATSSTRKAIKTMGGNQRGGVAKAISTGLIMAMRYEMATHKMYPLKVQPGQVDNLEELSELYLQWRAACKGQGGYVLKPAPGGSFLLFPKRKQKKGA